jgi:hypothetical protein
MPPAFDWAMPWLLVFFALSIGIAQFVFVYNFVKTLRRKLTLKEELEHERMYRQA